MSSKDSEIVVLDIGSSKIAGLVAVYNKDQKINVLANNIFKSKGFRSGRVINLDEAEESVLQTIYFLEKQYGKNISKVSLVLSGEGAKSYYIDHKIDISGSRVTSIDIQNLLTGAIKKYQSQVREIIHFFPVEYIVDNDRLVQDPDGILCKSLGCRIHIVVLERNILLNLSSCFSKSNIQISNYILGSYASGLSCMSEDEKSLGSMIFDLGAASTGFTIFLDKVPVFTSTISQGGNDITSDISKRFSISFELAEKMKILYGSNLGMQGKNTIINLDGEIQEDIDLDGNSIQTEEFIEVIHTRFKRIIEIAKADYDKLGIDHLVSRKIILTGGGSSLYGVKDLFSNIFHKQTRIVDSQVETLDKMDKKLNLPSGFVALKGAIYHNMLRPKHNYETDESGKITQVLSKIATWFKGNL